MSDSKKNEKKKPAQKTMQLDLDVWKILSLNKIDYDLDSLNDVVKKLLEEAGQYPSPLFA